MKALIFQKAGAAAEVLQLTDVATPRVTPGGVLIRIKARPVNPSDLYFIRGIYRKKPVFPQIAGLEGAGVIEACGPGVTSLKAGDHVFFRATGSWAEAIVIDEAAAIKVPETLPFDTACQVGLNGMTALALLAECSLGAGDTLLIDAATSSLAGLIIQLAVARDIRVVALVRSPGREEELLGLGAAQVLQQDAPSLAFELAQAVGENRINAFLDAVGGQVLTTVIDLMAPFGTILLQGNLSNGESAQFSNSQLVYHNLTIKGFGIDHWMSTRPGHELVRLYGELAADLGSGKLKFRDTLQVPFGQTFDPASKKKIILVS